MKDLQMKGRALRVTADGDKWKRDPIIIIDEWHDYLAGGFRRGAEVFSKELMDSAFKKRVLSQDKPHKPRGKGYGHDDSIPQPKGSQAATEAVLTQDEQIAAIVANRHKIPPKFDSEGNLIKEKPPQWWQWRIVEPWRPRVPTKFFYDIKNYRHKWKPPEPQPEEYGQW